ncbi:hypothetical protein C5749_00680 [Sphingobacterium gobiense]|uniref:Uncharacterized protein n=1 Tax=Sphingobacterium gobiense TaxID=1382456 RepID=A0A2S9JVR2_9SPHI|nr:hypothetical protein C5749_00680 [Sphingobacterium gobiense]
MPALVSGLLLLGAVQTSAQSNYKESSNSFARYTKSGDLKNLANAKKFIDETYKNRRDSNSVRVNVLRAMIYSSIAYADSTGTIKNPNDPIDITYESVNKIRKRDWENYASESNYIKQNLAASHIYKAKKALEKKDYAGAYESYLKVKDLNIRNYDVTYNLALLASQTEQYDAAIRYYNDLLGKGDAPVEYYLELAEIHKRNGDNQAILNTLHEARTKFPENKQVLLNLIQLFAQNNEYKAIAPIIDEAIVHEPEDIDLNYLAGYANENVGNIEIAKRYYAKVLQLAPNNYEANLALGLIFLNNFLQDSDNVEAQYQAQNLLLKANEIRPYDVNALKSLSLYYERSGDLAQLDRVKLLLNQLSNN